MNRRNFLKTSAGFSAILILPGVYQIKQNTIIDPPKRYSFSVYDKGKTVGKVLKITPDDGYYIHTFFDVCPFSPSQQYVAVTKIPFQDHVHKYGDLAEVCIIDLQNQTIKTVYKTKGWDFQLGANLNWGKTDRYLYTNDIIGNDAVCVRIDLENEESRAYSGPMYHISPDESVIIGFPLDLINVSQMGYGVPAFRQLEDIIGAPETQGLWKTDLISNKKEILVSLNQAFQKVADKDYLKGGNCYFFHSKFNPQGDKIFQVMRCLFPGNQEKKGWNPMLFTFDKNGNNITESLKRELWKGNHPNWHADGENIIMNLRPKWTGDNTLRFCRFHHTGGEIEILSEKIRGSGHPSITPDMKYLVTDCYVHEPMALENGKVPIRLINLDTEEEKAICYVFTDLKISENTLRIDPHPAWDRNYKKVCFNGAPEGKRQVYIADLEEII